MRKHITKPSITVIMETVGGHQDRITKAIESFQAQTYKDAILLVVNTHQERLVINNKPDNILIHNVEDVFTRPVYQHIYCMKLVVTDCWTILDDDDWITPNHLEQLVAMWNAQEERTESPLQVCIPHINAEYAEGIKELDVKGWMCSLFERLAPSEVDYVFKLFPKERICGSDTWIASNSYFDKRYSKGERTYNWDRTGSAHISQHEKWNEDKGTEHKFALAKSYWTNKISAHSLPLREITLHNNNLRTPPQEPPQQID